MLFAFVYETLITAITKRVLYEVLLQTYAD